MAKAGHMQVAGVVAESYARALFELAEQAAALDETADELRQIVSVLDANPTLRAVFDHPLINSQRRAETIRKLFEGRVSGLVYRFLQVLNAKGRLDQLAGVNIAFEQRLKDKRGEVDVEVHTARALDTAATLRVADRITAAIGKKAVLHPHVEPKLIGGLRVRVGDRLIDGSVATRLKRMRERMIVRGHDRLRDVSVLDEPRP